MTFMMVELGKEIKAGRRDARQRGGTKGSCENRSQRGTGATHICSSDSAFAELKQFEIKSENGAFLSLMVLGWLGSRRREVQDGNAKIITYAGFIILDEPR